MSQMLQPYFHLKAAKIVAKPKPDDQERHSGKQIQVPWCC